MNNAKYELKNYVGVHQIKKHYKEDEVSVYIHKNAEFNIRNDLSNYCKDMWNFCMEKEKYFIKGNGKIKPFENFLKKSF